MQSTTNGSAPADNKEDALPQLRTRVSLEKETLALLSPLAAEMAECQTFIDKDPDAFHAWLLAKHLGRLTRAEEDATQLRVVMETAIAESNLEQTLELADRVAAAEAKANDALKAMQSVNSQRLAYRAAMERAKGVKARGVDQANPLFGLRMASEQRRQQETAPQANA